MENGNHSAIGRPSGRWACRYQRRDNPVFDEGILACTPDVRPQSHQDLKHCRMKVLCVRQVDSTAPVSLKPSEQGLGVFDPALPLQKNHVAL
jgi:hypothetical protein